MLINSEEAERRLNSSSNLLNRLRRNPSAGNSAMSVFRPSADSTQIEPIPESDPAVIAVLDDIDSKVKEETIKNAALSVLGASVAQLAAVVPSIQRPKELADVASKMSKVINDMNKDGAGRNKDGNKTVHLHFYTPERKKLTDFEVIDV